MPGKLIGVGVGPGDPDLLTLKAIKTIHSCSHIAIPGKSKDKSVAYKIARQAIDSIDNKNCICLSFPMTSDTQLLENAHRSSALEIATVLDKGEDVAFLTLGDPTVYSTYMYVHKIIMELGYDTAIVNGITSFCAVASRLNTDLVTGTDSIHIIPATLKDQREIDFTQLTGTTVIMKSSADYKDLKNQLSQYANTKNITISMVENAGMENERIYKELNDFPESVDYFATILIKNL